jgi:archaemetzincin
MLHTVELVPAGMAGGGGVPALDLLDHLSVRLARLLHIRIPVLTSWLDIGSAWHHERQQVWSTEVLAIMNGEARPNGAVRVAYTELDLAVPVLTFVFGEALLSGASAVVSLHRLRNDFYGLPPDDGLLLDRALKETLHELGHTQGLRHCQDWRCVMSSAHAVERVDVRSAAFCRDCANGWAAAP